MTKTLLYLLEKLLRLAPLGKCVIQWGSPIPSFGDLSTATIATVGLNPSNREFVDHRGNELEAARRRFHTLRSLGLSCWSQAQAEHLELIAESCRGYFLR